MELSKRDRAHYLIRQAELGALAAERMPPGYEEVAAAFRRAGVAAQRAGRAAGHLGAGYRYVTLAEEIERLRAKDAAALEAIKARRHTRGRRGAGMDSG